VLPRCFGLHSYYSNPKMEAAHSSKTLNTYLPEYKVSKSLRLFT